MIWDSLADQVAIGTIKIKQSLALYFVLEVLNLIALQYSRKLFHMLDSWLKDPRNIALA